jgi:hypothetical protein
MIAFAAVHRRSVCRSTCTFEQRRTMAHRGERRQLQPQLQPGGRRRSKRGAARVSLKAAFGTPSDSSASSSRPGSSTGQQPLSGATAWARRPHARGVSGRMAVLHAPRLTPRPGGGHCATMAGAATLLKGNRHHPARRCLPRRRSCAADGCPTGCAITDGSPAHDDCPARRCAVRSRGWCEPWCPGGEASAFDEHPQRVEADAVVLPGLLHFVGLQHLLQLLKAGAFED